MSGLPSWESGQQPGTILYRAVGMTFFGYNLWDSLGFQTSRDSDDRKHDNSRLCVCIIVCPLISGTYVKLHTQVDFLEILRLSRLYLPTFPMCVVAFSDGEPCRSILWGREYSQANLGSLKLQHGTKMDVKWRTGMGPKFACVLLFCFDPSNSGLTQKFQQQPHLTWHIQMFDAHQCHRMLSTRGGSNRCLKL